MSYRPQVKGNSAGQLVDLPLDAETIQGKDIFDSNDIIKEEFLPQEVIEMTGSELEDATYVAGQLYYCTSASTSFQANKLYMGISSSEIVLFSSSSVSTKPDISSFSISPTSTEVGNNVTVTYTFSLKKPDQFTNLKISTGGTDIVTITPAASGSGTLSGSYSDNIFTMSGTTTKGSVSKNAIITPVYRQYFYATAETNVSTILAAIKDILSDSTDIDTVLANYLPSSISISNAGTASNTKYVYFITRHTISKVTSGGFDVPFESVTQSVAFTNHYGQTYNVKVYRTSSKVYGSIEYDLS